ncbi:hypothetical protein TVAG_105690 [Trichomonas vaginalis G3]|uniref:DUF3447 domain-containing protein n=1 Tax=Trichomonas vaginalis (strain ATCC PRA-98 / G3) TaxID=412133 RepID=A2FLQ8_TRIV3|nr:protein ubiquitination [Trichomonas vaginalis G3]EAX94150.1 hypothetical protein TVAG_105690 [Trichomonas vaginalis G3]KAI5518083.1 protein ubiquitination [Trichomonas vaginalis G3]|eukprot:XP_001307080.1 hypothetical protein [Trichomonas vaginalis G3]
MSECLKYQEPDRWCMRNAIISHNIDFVTFLMNEYDLEIDLDYCGEYNNLESFLIYFDQTNDIDDCILFSAKFNIATLCEYFLSHGGNVNCSDFYGQTPLHYTVDRNSKEAAELLLSYGANINEKDMYGETVLHLSIRTKNKDIVEFLLSHGANVNEKNDCLQTALNIAVFYENEAIIELLKSHGAKL